MGFSSIMCELLVLFNNCLSSCPFDGEYILSLNVGENNDAFVLEGFYNDMSNLLLLQETLSSSS
jgi:hypothetical protein